MLLLIAVCGFILDFTGRYIPGNPWFRHLAIFTGICGSISYVFVLTCSLLKFLWDVFKSYFPVLAKIIESFVSSSNKKGSGNEQG